MKLSDFDFELDTNLIASYPLTHRDDSKMLVVKGNILEDKTVKNFIDYINKGDVVVFNNTKVIPARFMADSHEITLHTQESKNIWWGFCKKFNKINIGDEFVLKDKTKIKILDKKNDSGLKIEFLTQENSIEVLNRVGVLPIPPYMKRNTEAIDNIRYQTVYASVMGSMAAPTAGLHFTNEMLKQIIEKGVKIVNITLHVGAGTFAPVKTENIEEHKMHSEYGIITQEQVDIIKKAKRVIAVGTTSMRLLESASISGKLQKFDGLTNIFIKPGFKFNTVDVLLTNFHLPKSTLLMLVSAFAGYNEIKQAYLHATQQKYRFFSYGDCCLLFRK